MAKVNAEALRWARAAAQAGDPRAMVLAGVILQESSVPEAGAFFAQAAPLLRVRARDRAMPTLVFRWATWTGRGLGVAQNPVEALAWMLRAQRLGISPMQVYALQSFEKTLSPDQRAQAHRKAEGSPQAQGKT